MNKINKFIKSFFKVIFMIIGGILLFPIIILLLPVMIPYAMIESEKKGEKSEPIKGLEDYSNLAPKPVIPEEDKVNGKKTKRNSRSNRCH